MNEMLSKLFSSGYPLQTEGDQLLQINAETAENGLFLTRTQAAELAGTHRRALSHAGRVEIGQDTVRKIMLAFSKSDYLNQENYADTLNEAVEIFYDLKNESEDRLSDDSLIALLFDAFERYKGSLAPYLQSRELNRLLRTLRFGEDYDAEQEPDEEEEEPDE